MKSDVETLNPTRVKLAVDVPYAELEPSLAAAYQSISRQVNIPGFRKGKVPPRIIDQRIGRGAVMEEALNSALPSLYGQAVEQADIRPIGQPELSVDQVPMAENEDLKFTVEVDVRPDFEVPDPASLEVTVDDIEVTDADIDDQIDEIRQRFGTLKTVDRPAGDGDFVAMDLVASKDDQEIDSAQGISYQVGLGTMVPGLDEALDGLSAGETTSFEAPLAGGEFAGQQGLIRVTVTAVKERELPELDADFVEMATEFDTVEELREDSRTKAAERKKYEQGLQARDRILDAALEKVDIPVPEGLVKHEVDHHLAEEGKAEDDEHRAEAETEVRTSVRSRLLLDAVAEQANVQVTQQEIGQHMVMTAYRYGIDPNEFIKEVSENGQIAAIMAEVARGKALLHMVSQASVKDTSGKPVDLSYLWESAEDDEPVGETVLAEAESVAKDADAEPVSTVVSPSANPAAVTVSDVGGFVPDDADAAEADADDEAETKAAKPKK